MYTNHRSSTSDFGDVVGAELSAMKSASTWDFKAERGWNVMSNSDNSTAHFSNRLEVSKHPRAFFSGSFGNT
jgi:hypothetical protein